MKNVAIWDETSCGFIINRRFGGTCHYHLTIFLVRVISSTLKMEETISSETSVYNKSTRHHFPEDGILPY
jgi:hypothetical protein